VPAAYDEVITVSVLADTDGASCGTGADTFLFGPDDAMPSSIYTPDPRPYFNYATLDQDFAHLIAAPGIQIYSTSKLEGYGTFQGTSMAAPAVAGAAALYLAMHTSATPGDVLSYLKSSGEPPGVNFRSQCASGGASHS